MGRSQWICNICTENFESRGKRDAHRDRNHRANVKLKLSDSREEEISRSETGKFACLCGKEFGRAHALRRHSVRCNTVLLSNETVDVSDRIDEGILQI
jgi:hypothetical protein